MPGCFGGERSVCGPEAEAGKFFDANVAAPEPQKQKNHDPWIVVSLLISISADFC